MHVLNVETGSAAPGFRGPTYLFNNWSGHGQQVAGVAQDLAVELGLSDGDVTNVERAARFHDIGKSRLPNCFEGAENRPDELNRPERELLMSHTWLGYRILQNKPNVDASISEAALLHHECWNGNGYPLGLARSDIPLAARIVAVADAYSTLLDLRPNINDRVGTRQIDDALTDVKSRAGKEFDPECVDALVAMVARARPPASALEL